MTNKIKLIIFYILLNNLLLSNISEIPIDKYLKLNSFFEMGEYWEGKIQKGNITKKFTKNSKPFGYTIIEKINNPLRIIALTPENQLIQIEIKEYNEKILKILKKENELFIESPSDILLKSPESNKSLKIPIIINSEKFFIKIKITKISNNFCGVSSEGIFDIKDNEIELLNHKQDNEKIEISSECKIFKINSNSIIKKGQKIPISINRNLNSFISY